MPPRQAEPSYANPLLVRFLEDFWRAAQDNNLKIADSYKRALKSLKECPVVFQHPSECKILFGFGPKFCEELTNELTAYNRHKGLPPPVIPKAHEVRQRVQQFKQYEEDQARKRMDRRHMQRAQKPYVPEPRTGGWAILRALYEVDDARGALTKDQIIARAQKWCDASFTIPPNPARPYTAWNSIETQKNHGYVRERKRGNETVYELTEPGLRTAHEIDENERNPDGPINAGGARDGPGDGGASRAGNDRHPVRPQSPPAPRAGNNRRQERLRSPSPILVVEGPPPQRRKRPLGDIPEDNGGFRRKTMDIPANVSLADILGVGRNDDLEDVVAVNTATAAAGRRLGGGGSRKPASASAGSSGRRPGPEIISLDDDDDDYMIARGFNTLATPSAALPSRTPIAGSSSGRNNNAVAAPRTPTAGSSSGRNNNAAAAPRIFGSPPSPLPAALPTSSRGSMLYRTVGSPPNPLPAALPTSSRGSILSGAPAARTPAVRPEPRAPPAASALLSIPLPAPLPAPEFPDLDLNNITTFNPPGVRGTAATYMVQLIVDSREVRTIEDRQYFAKHLPDNGVIPEQRMLNVGDFLWVARSREARLVLDHVVERKRFDDLLSSLIDNRFQDQKVRLKRSCVENVIYLIEDFQMPALDPETQQKVDGAIAATITVDEFFVKNTKDITKTVAYIATMTRRIEERWRERKIAQIPSRLVDPKTLPQLKAWLADRYSEYHWCLSLDDYNTVGKKDNAAKETGKDAYCKMLMCAKGISAEKANEVFRIYPTPRDLIEAWEKCSGEDERDRLLADATRAQVGAKKIPSSVSRKVKEIWWGED
ncbi:Similar to Crossover junction endonuclease mus81; acc. no. Q4WYE5 [Pyronema omphalodes CBS 100304]|uniref:Crossover junction endonuclease MUS81 n=1 Tax=Pyronema omphalodes (strain CBS 100304) TaxID=1076935 RepID=U4KXG1_PYROM|nr:Similar to Crossover junction endonuclease mus81; acc. no. Q4WYE5 [Pyronema omphalodes CBS 100304]